MKKLLIFLLIVFGIFALGDHLARGFAEDKAADELKNRLDLTSTPDVGLGGWPFLFGAVSGDFPSLQIDAERVQMDRFQFSEVHLDLRDMNFSVSGVLKGNVGEVSAGGGTGSASIDQEDLNSILRREGAPFSIRLQEGSAVAKLPGGDEVGASVEVSGGNLEIGPQAHTGAVTVELPGIVDNIKYESAEVADGVISVRLRIGPTTLQRELGGS
jgi:hypothetical protein